MDDASPFPLLLLWSLFWLGVHAVTMPVSVWALQHAFPAHAAEVSRVLASADAHQVAYWRRCIRGMVYYLFAAASGVALLGDFASVQSVLQRYTPFHSVAFNMAVAHWALTIYEDYTARHYIIRSVGPIGDLPLPTSWGMVVMPTEAVAASVSRGGNGVGYALFLSYIFHHVFAIGAFTFVQHTQQLASMTTFGLLYEFPVLCATVRELIATSDPSLRLMQRVNRDWFAKNWALTFGLYLLCRLPPSLVFLVYALFYYSSVMVPQVSYGARVSFWVFGLFFSAISLYWLGLLAMFYANDQRTFAAIDAGVAESRIAVSVRDRNPALDHSATAVGSKDRHDYDA